MKNSAAWRSLPLNALLVANVNRAMNESNLLGDPLHRPSQLFSAVSDVRPGGLDAQV